MRSQLFRAFCLSGTSQRLAHSCGLCPYFFDTDDGDGFLWDDEGQDLDGIEEVRLQAQSSLADIARDVLPGDGMHRTMVVRVRDESGDVVLNASLVLRVELKP